MYFIKNGKGYTPTDERDLDIHGTLPPGNYTIKQHPMNGPLYFDGVGDFTLPTKLYGNTTRHAGRILTTFQDRPQSTGVVLNGDKGSGKTLLAKTLSVRGAEIGMPTIIINQPWCGDAFNELIQKLDQPAIILFDEFEKVYDNDQQEAILTLLDGVFPTQKLFILTCNDKWRIDEHMRNRPGRIFYMLDFQGLDESFIREYCLDRLDDTSHTDTIVNMAVLFSSFNFDMLQALIEEMNRYKEEPYVAIEMLNAKPGSDKGGEYKVSIEILGRKIRNFHPNEWDGSPLNSETIGVSFNMYPKPKVKVKRKKVAGEVGPVEMSIEEMLAGALDEDTDHPDHRSITLGRDDLRHVNKKDESFVYVKDDITVTFTRVKSAEFKWVNYNAI